MEFEGCAEEKTLKLFKRELLFLQNELFRANLTRVVGKNTRTFLLCAFVESVSVKRRFRCEASPSITCNLEQQLMMSFLPLVVC